MKWTHWMMAVSGAALVAFAPLGCGNSSTLQRGDAGEDGGQDAGADAGADAGVSCQNGQTYDADAGACICVQRIFCSGPEHFDHVLCMCVANDAGH